MGTRGNIILRIFLETIKIIIMISFNPPCMIAFIVFLASAIIAWR